LPNSQSNVPQQMPIPSSQPNVPPQIPLSNGQSNVSQQTPQSNNSPQPINVPPFAKPQTPVSAPSVPRGTAVRAVSNPFVNSDVQNPLQSFNENRERDDASVMDDITVAAEPIPFLIREKDNHKVLIDKPVCRIGKERGYVDFCIDDNIAISRSHANIVKKENDYFIVDTGSTNHTYVDGKQIPNRTEVKLLHESKIKLANESFVFRIY
nr:FHA domain-containing protein [Lachnospiraceae bacterium]